MVQIEILRLTANLPFFKTTFTILVTVNKIHVLGSGYEKELLAQIPKENLPKQFGGTCECAGGCELSDAGPWQEPEFQGAYFKGADAGAAAAAAAPAAAETTTAAPAEATETQA